MEVKRNQIEEYKTFSEQKKANRTPFQLWKDLFGAHPILRVASIFFTLHLILVMFASILRDLFYDQFIVLMVIGQMFIFVHFNILWSVKLAAGNLYLIEVS